MQLKVTEKDMRVQRSLSRPPDRVGTGRLPPNGSFAQVLEGVEKSLPVTFSKHAEQRLCAWGGELDCDRMARLEDAVEVASAKGARSTLVLMKGVAFVVAPQTRTVVTVIPQERMKENLFTSIDSAVLVDR